MTIGVHKTELHFMNDWVKVHLMENVKCNWNNQAQGICNPWIFLDFGFLLLFVVQFSQNLTTSSQNTIMKVFTSPLSIVVTYEGKLTSYFSRRTGSLLNCFSRFANQRRIRIVIGPTTVFTVNQTLVNPPFWWISYQFKITVTLHTCTVNAHMNISEEDWCRYNCVYNITSTC